MNVKKLIGTGIGLAALVASLFAPVIPTHTSAFIVERDDKVIRKAKVIREIKETPYSWLYEKLGRYGNDRPDQKVVRIYGSIDQDKVGVGVGYILDDGFVLTANHVAEAIKDPYVSDGKFIYGSEGVVAKDAEKDLALLRIPVEKNYKPTKIGNDVAPREEVEIRTMDVEDIFYENYPASQLKIKQKRWKGEINIPPESLRLAEELKKRYVQLEQKIRELDELMYSSQIEEITTDFEFYKKSATESENYYCYTGEYLGRSGMSGSGIFNSKGELVGILVGEKRLWTEREIIIGVGLEEIKTERYKLIKERDELYNQIYNLLNPMVEVARGVSPQAILDFLEDYCRSTMQK